MWLQHMSFLILPVTGSEVNDDQGFFKKAITLFLVHNAVKGTYCFICWVNSNRGPQKERGQEIAMARVETLLLGCVI